MKSRQRKKQQGFTLIELMIVVAIIGVLSAIAVPAYKDYVKKSEGASALATMKSLITSSELWFQEHGTFKSTDKDLILADLGVTESSSPLGNIDITADNQLTFKFVKGSAVAENTTITYTRDPKSGWQCSVSDAAIATKSCPQSGAKK